MQIVLNFTYIKLEVFLHMSNRLDGKVAIVTGGTLGIGFAVAQKFVEEGAKVVITGRHADVGEAAAKKNWWFRCR